MESRIHIRSHPQRYRPLANVQVPKALPQKASARISNAAAIKIITTAMNPINFEISGCISGSAVMDNAAVLAKCRTRLSSVLRLAVQIQNAPPLRPSHPAMRHLEQLLNLCLVQSENFGYRGAILRKCLTADIGRDAIV